MVLSNGGQKVTSHDFRFPYDQKLLKQLMATVGVSPDMSSFMFTFVPHDSKQLVLLGHPPLKLIEEALTLPNPPAKLLIDQEEMHDDPKTYDVWKFQGAVQRYPINTPLAEALRKAGAPVPRPTFPTSGIP